MSALSLYQAMSAEERQQFVGDITRLGLVNELNTKNFRKHLKALISNNRGRIKQLYRRILTAHDSGANCDLFFTAITDPDKVLTAYRERHMTSRTSVSDRYIKTIDAIDELQHTPPVPVKYKNIEWNLTSVTTGS